MINGLQDRIIPAFYAEAYAKPLRAAGDRVRILTADLDERFVRVRLKAGERVRDRGRSSGLRWGLWGRSCCRSRGGRRRIPSVGG